jgi:hypothetical protein
LDSAGTILVPPKAARAAEATWGRDEGRNELPDVDLEVGPGVVFFADDASGYLADGIGDMLLHAVVCLSVDDGEEFSLESKLDLWGQFLPNVGVS